MSNDTRTFDFELYDWRSSINAIAGCDPALADVLRPMRFLSDILAWWQSASREITEIVFINQDEFTIDVVLPLPSSRWLVLDCT